MSQRILQLTGFALAFLAVQGCASLMRHSTSDSYPDSKSYPYCGVVYDGRFIWGGLSGQSLSDSGYHGLGAKICGGSQLVLFGLVDAPFSFCLDTILLPFDLYTVIRPKEKE
jgi:uncharacterized protein YceK